jgi:small subunit ribosomal protein S18
MALKKPAPKATGVRHRRLPSIQMIDYKDLALLEKCLTPQGQIQHRKRTGFSAQRQKQLKQAIKRARHLALLPFVN